MHHPYMTLCHLLHEFADLDAAMDERGMLRVALEIREQASHLVLEAVKNMDADLHWAARTDDVRQ